MKSKILVIATTLLMALAMMAQTATQATPAPAGDKATTCSCCNHDKADAKSGENMECCGKDDGCCKDGKMDCCSGDKCPMRRQKDGKTADGKSCCAGDKCPMMAAGKKDHSGCCCGNMAQPEHARM